MRKKKVICIVILFIVLMIPQNISLANSGVSARSNESVMLSYTGHIQRIGWSGNKNNGERLGTVGSSLRLEALKINVNNIRGFSGHVQYRSHVQTYGWEKTWRKEGEISGTEGKSKRLEAVQIKLTGDLEKYYDVYYRVHTQTFGWLDWAKNGETAGSEGYSKRVEAIEIVLVDKGDPSPGTQAYSSLSGSKGISYSTHVQTYGWQGDRANGNEAGTVGVAKRLESIKIKLLDCPYSGHVEYKSHIQTYGWEDTWKTDGQKSGTEGQSKRLEAIRIRLTGELAEKCDIYYRVHSQRLGWLGWVKNGEEAGTAGFAYRLESIQILLLPKNARTFDSTVGFIDKNDIPATPDWIVSDIYTDSDEMTVNTNTPISFYNVLEEFSKNSINCRYIWRSNSTKEEGVIGEVSIGNSVTWTPTVSGKYTIIMIAEDEFGRSLEKQLQLEVVRPGISIDEVFFTAHRGLSSQAPDNSIPAFILAGENGFDSIETDVIETKDGVFLVSHDNNLSNVCGINKNISDLTYAELSDYNNYHIITGANAGRFSKEELRIPTLEEYLDVCIHYGCIPQLDMKNLNSFESVERVYDILVKYGVQDDAIVTSFNNLYLQLLREMNPNISLTYGVDTTAYLDYNWLQNYNIGVSVQYNNILNNNFQELAERNIAINVYTVKDVNTAKVLVDKGVTSITTDRILWE